MNRDNHDMQMLKAIQKIAKNLEIIAKHLEPELKQKEDITDMYANPYQE